MSTHPNDQVDLDRTDELPRLDLEAYESSIANEANDTLSATDSWSNDTILHQAPETEASSVTRIRTRPAHTATTKISDVTLEATRILGRLAQLESELAAAKAQYGDLNTRFERLTLDFGSKEKEVRALSSDNTRLSEQRSIALTRVQTLEQQIRDETAQYERDLAQHQEARSAEQKSATTARLALEQQVTELTELASQLKQNNAHLENETKSAAKLAKSHIETIEQTKQRLNNEERNSAQLARHLAAKIADHATAGSEIERREAAIRALRASESELTTRLQDARAAHAALVSQHVEITQQYATEQGITRERDKQIAERNEHIARDTAELQRANSMIAALTEERDTTLRTLTTEREAQARAQQVLSDRAQQIDQLHGSAGSLQAQIATLQQQLAQAQQSGTEQHIKLQDLERALGDSKSQYESLSREMEAARARLQQFEEDAVQALSVRDSLTSKSTDLHRVQEELAAVQRDLDEVRANLVTKHSELAQRDESLRETHEFVADLRKVNDGLQQSATSNAQRMAELEARERDREENVLANAADLAAARRQLGQQLAAVQSMEQAIRARDTLTERLRGELQTVQDERAIMSVQLEKSRARNKSIAREIFSRDNQIATLKADLAVHVETLAAIRQDVNRTSMLPEVMVETGERILEPIDHSGDVIVLNKKVMTIGRTNDNDICIPSKLVSRNHARLLVGPNAVILEDAGSTNGCFVNEVQVKQQLMRDNDVLSVGDLKYRLCTRVDNPTRIRDNIIPFGDNRHNND